MSAPKSGISCPYMYSSKWRNVSGDTMGIRIVGDGSSNEHNSTSSGAAFFKMNEWAWNLVTSVFLFLIVLSSFASSCSWCPPTSKTTSADSSSKCNFCIFTCWRIFEWVGIGEIWDASFKPVETTKGRGLLRSILGTIMVRSNCLF